MKISLVVIANGPKGPNHLKIGSSGANCRGENVIQLALLRKNGHLLSDNMPRNGPRSLNDRVIIVQIQVKRCPFSNLMSQMMKRFFKPLLAAAALAVLAGPLHAACYADYRARMDNPLRLHYGVIEVPQNACSVGAASGVVASRLAAQGWTLVNVGSVFDESGLASRRADAGEYYLRF